LESRLDATVTQRILSDADIDCPTLILTAISIQGLERHTSQAKEFLVRGFAAHLGPDLDRRRDHNRCQMLLCEVYSIYGRKFIKANSVPGTPRVPASANFLQLPIDDRWRDRGTLPE
jgi:hypothetical protein